MSTIVVATGGFDPIHEGHIEYLKAAKKIGLEKTPISKLVVGLNSDEWLAKKKGQPFMGWVSRYVVLSNLRMVDEVIAFDDFDGSAVDCIKKVMEMYPNSFIIFANGGDRTSLNIPEMKWAAHNAPNVHFEFGVGGEQKTNSSSWILDKWKNNV